MKKPFRETKIGQFLSTKGVDILNVVDDYFPPAKILTALLPKNLSPEEMAQATKLIQEYELEVAKIDLERERLSTEDRKSARERETSLGRVDWMMNLTGLIGLGAFVYIIYALFNLNIPHENREFAIHLLGIIEGIVIGIYGYYFGTSKSSAMKTKLLKQP